MARISDCRPAALVCSCWRPYWCPQNPDPGTSKAVAGQIITRSPSSAPSHPFFGEGSPTKIDYRKSGYPSSNVSAGGPRLESERYLSHVFSLPWWPEPTEPGRIRWGDRFWIYSIQDPGFLSGPSCCVSMIFAHQGEVEPRLLRKQKDREPKGKVMLLDFQRILQQGVFVCFNMLKPMPCDGFRCQHRLWTPSFDAPPAWLDGIIARSFIRKSGFTTESMAVGPLVLTRKQALREVPVLT